MKFSISLEQRNYLQKNGFIPFYELLNEGEIKRLDLIFQKKIDVFRDLWRSYEELKPIVFSKRLVDLAYELIQKKPLRFAFDRFIPGKKTTLTGGETPLKDYFGENSIEERSCLRPLVGMFVILLEDEEEMPKGSGYFILPQSKFPFLELSKKILLIAYTDQYGQYFYETKDPDVHYLKNLGYVFGDRLNDQLHPILLR